MTGRRARRAHRPTAAFWWGTAKWCALIGASAALGVSLALVAAEAIFHGRWAVTAEAASVAFLGVFLGALGAVAHALMVHAIDGPPSVGTGPWTMPLPPVRWTDEPLTAAQLNAQVRDPNALSVVAVDDDALSAGYQAVAEDRAAGRERPSPVLRANMARSIEAAGREQAWCPTCESTDRAVLLDQGDGLPRGDPMGWHSPDAAEPVPDDVREDARRHADEDDPFGVIGGAP